MDEDAKLIQDLIAHGVVGASMAAILSKNKGQSAAMIRAIFLATYKAHQEARKSGVPLLIKEGNKLYMLENGKKTFFKDLPVSEKKYEKRFKLKTECQPKE